MNGFHSLIIIVKAYVDFFLNECANFAISSKLITKENITTEELYRHMLNSEPGSYKADNVINEQTRLAKALD